MTTEIKKSEIFIDDESEAENTANKNVKKPEILSDDVKKLMMKTFSDFEKYLQGPQEVHRFQRKCNEYWDDIEYGLKEAKLNLTAKSGALDARIKNFINDMFKDYEKYLPSDQDRKMYQRKFKGYWDIIEAGIKAMNNFKKEA